MKKIKEIFSKNNKRNDVNIVKIIDEISNKLDEISIWNEQHEIGVDHWQKKYLLPGVWNSVVLENKFHNRPRSYQEVILTIERFKSPLSMYSSFFLNEVKDLIKKHKLIKANIK